MWLNFFHKNIYSYCTDDFPPNTVSTIDQRLLTSLQTPHILETNRFDFNLQVGETEHCFQNLVIQSRQTAALPA